MAIMDLGVTWSQRPSHAMLIAALPPFAFNVPDTVSSQLASEVFDSFDVQDVASSSTSPLYVPQGGASSRLPASFVQPKPLSLKRGRLRGGSPPSKFVFAAARQKEKQD